MKKEINYEWYLPRILTEFESVKIKIVEPNDIFHYEIGFGMKEEKRRWGKNTHYRLSHTAKNIDKKDWINLLKLMIEKEKKLVFKNFNNAARGFCNTDMVMLTYLKKEFDYKAPKTLVKPFIKNTIKSYAENNKGKKNSPYIDYQKWIQSQSSCYRQYTNMMFNYFSDLDYLIEYLITDESFSNIFFEELNEEKYPRLYEKYKHAKEMFIF